MRSFRFFIFLLLELIVFARSQNAFSQRYNFVNYSLEDGLPQSQVSDICQDRFGYLWIGTETGLSRFDGIEFRNFSTDDGLPDNEIDKLYLDAQNKLWIATPKGLAKYVKSGFVAYDFSRNRDVEFNINDFTELNGVMYLAADEGMLRFENDSCTLIQSDLDHANFIRGLVTLGDTLILCGSRNGLFQFDGKKISHFAHPDLEGLNISDLAVRGDEILISTYGNGIVVLNLKTGYVTVTSLPINRIRSMHMNSKSILCATKNGAIEIGSDQVYFYNLTNGLIFENIRCVFTDREENIWLGTDGKGLLRLTGKSILSYKKADGLSSDAVMGISQDKAGFYYFSTYDAGLTKWNPDTTRAKTISYSEGLKNTTIWTTFIDQNNYCWIGSSGGVDILDARGALLDNQVTQSLTSKTRTLIQISDSVFLFGGSGGVHYWNGKSVSLLFQNQTLDVNKMIVAKSQLYLATTTGLYVADLLALQNDADLIELPENNVKSVAFDKEGNLWVGTNSSGIYVLKPDGDLYPFILDYNDTRSKTVLGIISDASGDIWVSTLNGVYQIIFQVDQQLNYQINHFGYAEGLVTLECNQNAIYEDFKHHIWVGTSEGLIEINPSLNKDLFRFRKPELIITGVRLFMEDFDYGTYNFVEDEHTGVPISITLPYNKNHLTFDFIGLHLKDPDGVQYQYRLVGAEENWSPLTKNRYATYALIDNGEYDFEVRATNNSGDWSEISRMHVTILPPFWLTWWFILLMILAGVALIVLVFQIRIRAIKQKQENEKLGYKNRLLFLEQQSLNASMNRHFIFNSLNSIQYFINSSNKLAANKYLTSFAKLIRKNLDSSQANNFIVTLKEEIERIELYLSLEKMRFDGKFEYEIQLDEEIDTESLEIPSMILQPFVENSIIHGVLPIERKGLIRIRIYIEFGYLIFEVVDDGIGIDTSLGMKKPDTGDSHDSMGMEITSRRIDLLRKLTGENLMIIGPFQMNDEAGKCLGTKVIIKINVENQGEN